MGLRQHKSKLKATESEIHEEHRRFRLGYEVDPLALIALLLALVSAVWQVLGYFKGADIILMAPKWVEIRALNLGGEGSNYSVYVRSQMSYVNKGRPEYPSVITSEDVRMSYHGNGGGIIHFDSIELHGSFWNQTGKAKPGPEDGAHEFMVAGLGVESHEVDFYPERLVCDGCRSDINFIQWSDLVAAVKQGGMIDFDFEV